MNVCKLFPVVGGTAPHVLPKLLVVVADVVKSHSSRNVTDLSAFVLQKQSALTDAVIVEVTDGGHFDRGTEKPAELPLAQPANIGEFRKTDVSGIILMDVLQHGFDFLCLSVNLLRGCRREPVSVRTEQVPYGA